MAELIKVAEVFLVKENEQFVGVELGFNENVLNKRGAASVLDTLRSGLNNAGWVTSTVMRVEDREENAPSEPEGSAGGDTGAEAPKPKRGKKADAE